MKPLNHTRRCACSGVCGAHSLCRGRRLGLAAATAKHRAHHCAGGVLRRADRFFLGGVRWGAAMQNATTGTALARELAQVSSPRSSRLPVTFFRSSRLAMLLILITRKGWSIFWRYDRKTGRMVAPLRLLLSAVAGASLASILVYLTIQ